MATEKTTNNVTTNETMTVETAGGKKEIKKDSRIEFEPIAFEVFSKCMRIKASELAKMISAEFKKKFHDCKGCYIGFNGQFNVTLYFQNNPEPLPEGKIKNLINLQTTEGLDRTSIFKMNKLVQNRQAGDTFTLDDGTKLLLSDFMYGGRGGNKVNDKKRWDQNIIERRVPASNVIYQYGAENILIGVTNLNLKVLCHALFGDTIVTATEYDEDGVPYNKQARGTAYEVRFAKALPNNDVMINIEQFDKNAVEELVRAENPQIAQMLGGVTMY